MSSRSLAWHDLAFYNADLYEGLRQMMLDAEQGKKDKDEFIATYCSYFEVREFRLAHVPGILLEDAVCIRLLCLGSSLSQF